LSLKFTTAQAVEASASYTYSWETSYCLAVVRIGPEIRDNQEPLQNRWVFLCGFQIMVRERSMAALKRPAKVVSILDAKPGNLHGGKGNYIPFKDGGKRSGSAKDFGNNSEAEEEQVFSDENTA
jgi:hypothetical protein